jgi:hypothetical protein
MDGEFSIPSITSLPVFIPPQTTVACFGPLALNPPIGKGTGEDQGRLGRSNSPRTAPRRRAAATVCC